MAQLDKVLVSGAWWKAPDVQVGFTQLFPAAVVAAVVAAAVCAGAGRSHGMGSWCIGLLETEKAVTANTKPAPSHRPAEHLESNASILASPIHTCPHILLSLLLCTSENIICSLPPAAPGLALGPAY